jgi:NADH-quinone oxidoreductase subunit H
VQEVDVALPFLRASLLVATAVVLYPPLAWLDRWAQLAPGAEGRVTMNPLLPLANALKLLHKRAALPAGADRLVHNLAPMLALTPALFALATLPLAPAVTTSEGPVQLSVAGDQGTVAASLSLLLLSTAGVAAAGWAGANHLALLAALRLVLLRAAALVVVGLGAAGVCLIHATPGLDELVVNQSQPFLGDVPALGVLVNPVGFICVIVALAVLGQRQARSRPDDHADLVSPYAAEASGPSLLAHRLFEVLDQAAFAGLVATVFLGGWMIPGVDGPDTLAMSSSDAALRLGVFVLKLLGAATLVLLVRRSLPPVRHDQALTLMWVLVVAAAVGLSLSTFVFARVAL